jgi:DNA-directed RNA polymerase subunit RPC12/RpoP
MLIGARVMTEKTINRKCAHCGKTFLIIPSRLKHGRGLHCSSACQYAAIKERPKKVKQFICIGCGDQFTRPQSKKTKGNGKYCTRACRDLHWIGQNTSQWQNGDGVYKRGPRWYSIRRRILKRDQWVCCRCGKPGRDVHHKIPFRLFADEDAANADWNLITLCRPCHRREDAKYKWVPLCEGVLRFSSAGPLWQMAREKGMV